jgi:hypothetical protein
MKKTKMALTGLLLIATLTITGCKLFGANPVAPTTIEHYVYIVQTNYVPTPVLVTNTVTVTNVQGVVTNQPVVTTTITQVPQYVLTTSPTTTATVQAGGTALNSVLPGVGSMVSMGVLALLGLWAQLRSSKNGNAASAIAQEVETMREFIMTLPNGTKYDTAITSWLQSHQIETGTVSTVLGILANDISNPDAKAAVTEIQQTINAAAAPAPAAAAKTS